VTKSNEIMYDVKGKNENEKEVMGYLIGITQKFYLQ